MRIIDLEQRSSEWLEARRGKLTGTRLKDVVVQRGTKKKIGFYEVLAERLAYAPDGQNPMERGVELEDEAIDKVSQYLEKPIEKVGFCVHDEYPSIAVSPDGLIKSGGKYTEAVEVKCLASSRHLQMLVEGEVPEDYYWQMLQYFIVIDTLEKLHFCSYDPRMVGNELVVITVKREDVAEDIAKWYEYEVNLLKELDELTARFSQF
jgi:putative phage-type endonuclease